MLEAAKYRHIHHAVTFHCSIFLFLATKSIGGSSLGGPWDWPASLADLVSFCSATLTGNFFFSPSDDFRLIAPANRPFCWKDAFFLGGKAFVVVEVEMPAAIGGEPDVEGRGGEPDRGTSGSACVATTALDVHNRVSAPQSRISDADQN